MYFMVVVVVKSTSTGDTDSFNRQDALYTLLMKSVHNGVDVQQSVICSAISRVLIAAYEWKAVLECAADPGIQVIISNTTEVGIELLQSDLSVYFFYNKSVKKFRNTS